MTSSGGKNELIGVLLFSTFTLSVLYYRHCEETRRDGRFAAPAARPAAAEPEMEPAPSVAAAPSSARAPGAPSQLLPDVGGWIVTAPPSSASARTSTMRPPAEPVPVPPVPVPPVPSPESAGPVFDAPRTAPGGAEPTGQSPPVPQDSLRNGGPDPDAYSPPPGPAMDPLRRNLEAAYSDFVRRARIPSEKAGKMYGLLHQRLLAGTSAGLDALVGGGGPVDLDEMAQRRAAEKAQCDRRLADLLGSDQFEQLLEYQRAHPAAGF